MNCLFCGPGRLLAWALALLPCLAAAQPVAECTSEADDARRLGIPQDAWVVLYCSCPNEETSSRVARDLKRRGYTRARALVGGWKAWQEAGLPVAPMPSRAGA